MLRQLSVAFSVVILLVLLGTATVTTAQQQTITTSATWSGPNGNAHRSNYLDTDLIGTTLNTSATACYENLDRLLNAGEGMAQPVYYGNAAFFVYQTGNHKHPFGPRPFQFAVYDMEHCYLRQNITFHVPFPSDNLYVSPSGLSIDPKTQIVVLSAQVGPETQYHLYVIGLKPTPSKDGSLIPTYVNAWNYTAPGNWRDYNPYFPAVLNSHRGLYIIGDGDRNKTYDQGNTLIWAVDIATGENRGTFAVNHSSFTEFASLALSPEDDTLLVAASFTSFMAIQLPLDSLTSSDVIIGNHTSPKLLTPLWVQKVLASNAVLNTPMFGSTGIAFVSDFDFNSATSTTNAMNVKTGVPYWSYSCNQSESRGSKFAITATSKGTIFFSCKRRVEAHDERTGVLKWLYNSPPNGFENMNLGGLLATNNYVLVGRIIHYSQDSISIIDRETGARVNETTLGGSFVNPDGLGDIFNPIAVSGLSTITNKDGSTQRRVQYLATVESGDGTNHFRCALIKDEGAG